jgi:hypothetical protein
MLCQQCRKDTMIAETEENGRLKIDVNLLWNLQQSMRNFGNRFSHGQNKRFETDKN